jgi:RimJ/RimL family protein N-acetyltransferase
MTFVTVLYSGMSADIRIRELDNSHADACTALLIRAVGEHPTHFHSSPDDIRSAPPMKLEIDDPNSFTLGAFDVDGSLVGVVGFYRQTLPKLAHRGIVYRMYVPIEQSGKGIGRRLMEALIDRARRQEGLVKIDLFMTSTNERARHLYESLGFVKYAVQTAAICYDGQFYDEDHMVLFL